MSTVIIWSQIFFVSHKAKASKSRRTVYDPIFPYPGARISHQFFRRHVLKHQLAIKDAKQFGSTSRKIFIANTVGLIILSS